MAANVSFNPLLSTVASGSFSVQSDGYVQGIMMDDPALRYELAGGILASTETLPMWGGVGISESIPAVSVASELGSSLARATLLTNLTGFSVFNQASNWVLTPQSRVPTAAVGMTVPFFRLGCGMRLALQIDPALVSLDGGLVSQQVSWDFGGQRIVPYVAAYPANAITAATWSGNVVTYTTTTAHGVGVGDDFSISGMSPAGYNGSFTATSGTTGSTLKATMLVNPGASTVQGTLLAGGGALPVKILKINVGNSKIVTYDAVNNYANWNNSGSCAEVLI